MMHNICVCYPWYPMLYLIFMMDNINIWWSVMHNIYGRSVWWTLLMPDIYDIKYLYCLYMTHIILVWCPWYIIFTSGIHDTQFLGPQHLCLDPNSNSYDLLERKFTYNIKYSSIGNEYRKYSISILTTDLLTCHQDLFRGGCYYKLLT